MLLSTATLATAAVQWWPAAKQQHTAIFYSFPGLSTFQSRVHANITDLSLPADLLQQQQQG